MMSPLDDPAPVPAAYARDAPRVRSSGTLTGRVEADVVVVGAGFAGISAAYHLAEEGLRPVVLEARDVGSGAAGRNFGQVVPYTKHSESHVLRSFGQERGRRLIDAAASGPDLVFSLIDTHGLACWSVRRGLLFAAHGSASLGGLQARAAYWRERGAPIEMLNPSETAEHVGSGFYRAALLERRGGTINPLAFVRGLANVAVDLGASIHENTRVLGIERTKTGWRIRSGDGTISARTVLLTTDAYTDGFAPELRRSLIPIRAYQLVSHPLGDNMRGTILPHGQSVTDTRRLYSGVRMHPSGRLHVSLDGPPFTLGEPFRNRSAGRISRLFPHLGPIEWDEAWSGWVGMTADQYPRLIKAGPNLLAALGFSGRGIALATLFGRELARHVLGAPEEDLVLPLTRPEPIRVRRLSRPLVGGLINLYRVLDGVDDARLRSRNRQAARGA